jgi:hypothetical protein
MRKQTIFQTNFGLKFIVEKNKDLDETIKVFVEGELTIIKLQERIMELEGK